VAVSRIIKYMAESPESGTPVKEAADSFLRRVNRVHVRV
jgi:hypothetical protein